MEGKALATIQIAIDQIVCTTGTCIVVKVTSVMEIWSWFGGGSSFHSGI